MHPLALPLDACTVWPHKAYQALRLQAPSRHSKPLSFLWNFFNWTIPRAAWAVVATVSCTCMSAGLFYNLISWPIALTFSQKKYTNKIKDPLSFPPIQVFRKPEKRALKASIQLENPTTSCLTNTLLQRRRQKIDQIWGCFYRLQSLPLYFRPQSGLTTNRQIRKYYLPYQMSGLPLQQIGNK